MIAEELFRKLENDPLERLKWLVLCRFGVLPGSVAAKELSDEDYLRCGVHMVLDCRACEAICSEDEQFNASFDEERYRYLAEEHYEQ